MAGFGLLTYDIECRRLLIREFTLPPSRVTSNQVTGDKRTELGRVVVRSIVAARDVGRAINPIQVEGQIHHGNAPGFGFRCGPFWP